MPNLDPSKPLLLVDLNGTVCFRTDTKVPGIQYDLYVRRKYCYFRHGAKEVLQKLSKDYNVAIYSSVMLHNIEPVMNALMRDWEKFVFKIFHRDYNKVDPLAVEKWDTIRDMDKIFDFCNDEFEYEAFSLKNTIILDNEVRKFKECMDNGIMVGEYGSYEVVRKVEDSLQPVLEYLTTPGLLSSSDVAEWMGCNPLKDRIHGSRTLAKIRNPTKALDDNLEETFGLERLSVVTGLPSKKAMTSQEMLDKYGDKEVKLARIINSKMIYTGLSGLRVEGNVTDDLVLDNKMNLKRLWEIMRKEKGVDPVILIDDVEIVLKEE